MATPTALEIPGYLSGLPRKRALYATDTYFREGFEDLTAVAGGLAERFCHDHALLLVKPDAVVSRRLGAVLRWLLAHGFAIVWAAVITVDRHGIRALWQYGLNAASRDRRDAADLYLTASDCLLLVLALPGRPEPASLVLSQVKGSADPVSCRPGQIRYDVGSVNYQLNLVHAADEPADLVRELAVLCDHETRTEVYRRVLDRCGAAVRADPTAQAFSLAERLESATPAVDLDIGRTLAVLAEAADRVAAAERAISGAPSRPAKELRYLISRVRRRASRDWRGLLRLAEECQVPVTRWQRIVLATHLLDPHLPGVASLLPDGSAEHGGSGGFPGPGR